MKPPPAGAVASTPTNGQTTASRRPNREAGGDKSPAPSTALEGCFGKHLEVLKSSRRRSAALLEAACPGHNAAEASVAVAWEFVFDLLVEREGQELAELNTLSSIIHKLMSAFTQIRNLELKVREQEMKEEDRAEKKRSLLGELKETEQGLRPETLKTIEERLNLL
ncbi:MAG: hypothetical protein AAGA45_04910 [Verrucomicrobiota bacterium]